MKFSDSEEIQQYLEDIELDRRHLQKAVKLKRQIPAIIEQYSDLQQNMDRELADILDG